MLKPTNIINTIQRLLPIFILSCAAVYALFVVQGNIGLSLRDEGFLWYGVQRVMAGDVPIRDFMAYEPGRYYWSAALMKIWGNDGIIALRTSVAIFQVIGLFTGLSLILSSGNIRNRFNSIYLLLSACILLLWMHPYYKIYDITISILLIACLAWLAQNPSQQRYLITGISIGLIAVFGRNHGVYGLAACLGIMLWLNVNNRQWNELLKDFAHLAGGVLVGFSPVLLMALYLPGFASAFWQSILFHFEINATNLPLPVPWPWRVDFSATAADYIINEVLVGLFFIAILAFGSLSILWVVWQKTHQKPVTPLGLSLAFLALPYTHYAYSRADVAHLAFGIFPFLIGCLVYFQTLAPKKKWSLALILCSASLLVMLIVHPAWRCHVSVECENIQVFRDTLKVTPREADDIRLLRNLASHYAQKNQTFLAVPYWPGAYALLDKKAPFWEICALFPRPVDFQQEEINHLKMASLGFVIMIDQAQDGREELRYMNSHPLIYAYILANFDRVRGSPRPAYHIYQAKQSRP